jgi:GDP-4-dehydro-6-deoxy-D-mannose reductase
VEEVRVDLTDAGATKRVLGDLRPDVVFHLAAVVDTVSTPSVVRLHECNVIATASVLDAARGVPGIQRVLVASSSFAYGRAGGKALITEQAPLLPRTAYGASKAAAEAIALAWGRELGRDVVVTRAFQHTGPGHVGPYAMSDWAGQLASGATDLRVGNLEVVRDYLDVRDVAEAYVAVMEHGRAGEVYNVCSGVPRTMESLLSGLLSAFDSRASVAVDPTRVRRTDDPYFVGSPERLHEVTGWSPAHDFETTLADLAEWHRARVERSAESRAAT